MTPPSRRPGRRGSVGEAGATVRASAALTETGPLRGPLSERFSRSLRSRSEFLLCLPRLDAVVVITSTHQGKGIAWDRAILGRIERELLPVLRRSEVGRAP